MTFQEKEIPYRPFAVRPSAPINNVISSKCTFFASIMADIPMERSIVAGPELSVRPVRQVPDHFSEGQRVTNSQKWVYGFRNLWISSKDFTDFS